MDELAESIQRAVEAIVRIEDPEARAKAATDALDVIHKANGTLAKLRREDIKALRAAGLSYRAIGEAIGIHFTRVKQIETGAPTGNSARGRAAKSETPPAE